MTILDGKPVLTIAGFSPGMRKVTPRRAMAIWT